MICVMLMSTEIQRFEIVGNDLVQELVINKEEKRDEVSFEVRIPRGFNKIGIMFSVCLYTQTSKIIAW